jgi:hypothetical protein
MLVLPCTGYGKLSSDSLSAFSDQLSATING